jgi:prolyl oligopeptidase
MVQMKSIKFYPFLLLIIIWLISVLCTKKVQPPTARTENIQDTLYGVVVSDPYRWLENWNDPAVQEWSNQQNAYARNFLDQLPHRQEIENRISQIYWQSSVSYYDLRWSNGKFFAMKNQPDLNQPLLVYLTSLDDPASEHIILDLNRLDSTHSTSIDWYEPSPDGNLLAVSLSIGGSENGDLHIYESATGRQVFEVIPTVNKGTAGGDIAWVADGKGFYYTRYPQLGERPAEDLNFYQQVWFHQLGTPLEQDRYIIGKDFPRIVEIRLDLDRESGDLLVTTQYGDGGTFAHYLLDQNGKWSQLTTYEDEVVEVLFAPENSLILISHKEAPMGKLLHLPLSRPILKNAHTLIPESDGSICSEFGDKSKVVPGENFLYVTYQLGGPSEIRTFNYQGKRMDGPELLSVASIHEITPLNGDEILFSTSSYLIPRTWFHYQPQKRETSRLAISSTSPVDYSDCEVLREFAVSKDGTRIPVNILKQKTLPLDGNNPALLYGYGGYGINEVPYFSSTLRVWIEQGGIYAVANLRGGGEYGEEWHRAGMLTNKQNVFDDFAAVMNYLIEKGYTNPQKLAINGGSNGGLLMGAMITQHPGLFKATVSTVGVYDMIRVELSPNGNFNVPEYGTVKNLEQFKAMYAYSPYHNVQDGTAYPAVLFMTGANDPRVDPLQSRKMIARLLAATSSNNPILLRTSSTTGHGGGTPLDERIQETTDKYSFLFNQLNVKYQPVH